MIIAMKMIVVVIMATMTKSHILSSNMSTLQKLFAIFRSECLNLLLSKRLKQSGHTKQRDYARADTSLSETSTR